VCLRCLILDIGTPQINERPDFAVDKYE